MQHYLLSRAFAVLLLISQFALMQAQKPYFQQEVNYIIKTTLNDTNHSLTAFETIQYINNSPDSLKYLYFHLWPNAYKNKYTAFSRQQLENGDHKFYFSTAEEKGFIDSLDFCVNGRSIEWELDEKYIDICKLELNSALLPGDTIQITTPFYVKIPGSFSRFGHVGQSYQITQWYPKPAVYGPDGWHPMPYLDQGEFFSEYGSFDVEITLPAQYVVGATGELQTPEEILWLNKKTENHKTPRFEDSTGYKTIRFYEKNVHDFAWFADKSYWVKKDSVQLPNSSELVTTWALFPPKDSVRWLNATGYINDALFYYSQWYGNYPYKNCIAVRGAIEAGGAMEYPGITVVGGSGTPLALETMIMHEVGHNWFYGILGFNERDYPFLDEGINSFSEFRYLNEKYKRSKKLYEMMLPETFAKFANISELPQAMFYEISSLMPQRLNIDQPIVSKSTDVSMLNYGSIIYHKSALAFYYLMHSIGEEKFNSIMKGFYEDWKFKHPHPADLKYAFESGTNTSLGWFFDDILLTSKKTDYKVKKIENGKILVRNTGKISSPLTVTGYNKSNEVFLKKHEGFYKSKWIELPASDYTRLVINDIEMPEYNRKNNTIKTSGICKKIEPLEINKFQVIEKPGKTQIGILPAAGWNYTDKLMAGVLIYNPVIPMQKAEYQLLPMYGTGSKTITGAGKFTLHTFLNSGVINRIDIHLMAQRYAETDKARAEAILFIKRANDRSQLRQSISLAATVLSSNITKPNNQTGFFNLKYVLKNKYLLNPFNLLINFEIADNSPRLCTEFNLGLPAKYAREALSIRIFGGYIFNEKTNYPLYLSGVAAADYQHDYIIPARFDVNSETLLSYQTIDIHGGFAALSPFSSNKWLTTAKLKLKIPEVPLKFYATAGLHSNGGKEFFTGTDYITLNNLNYETGVALSFGKFLEVYFPVLVSSDFETYLNNTHDKYVNRIRFSLNFNMLNLFTLRDNIFE